MSLPEQGIGSKALGVKLFSFPSHVSLEGELNSWLSSSSNLRIHDVIYQQSMSMSGERDHECHSCMVIYGYGPN